MADVGLTHVALGVSDPARSAEFYRRFADMEVVHRRPNEDGDGEILWLSDRTRPFVIVLLPQPRVDHRLRGLGHLGVGLATREFVAERLATARNRGCAVLGPTDSGPPVGYWGFIEDPDGHILELSHGQEVGLAVSSDGPAEVERASDSSGASPSQARSLRWLGTRTAHAEDMIRLLHDQLGLRILEADDDLTVLALSVLRWCSCRLVLPRDEPARSVHGHAVTTGPVCGVCGGCAGVRRGGCDRRPGAW